MLGLSLLTLAACEPFRVLGADNVVVIDGEDRIGVRDDTLDFGTVSAMAALPGEVMLHVENLGDTEVPVYVDGTGLEDTSFFLLSDSRIFSLANGESADIPLYFAPSTDGVQEAELVLQPGGLRVTLHATGTAPVASVTPVDAGNVVLGCTAACPLRITNTGSELLTVTGATTSSEGFSVEPSNLSLQPGEYAELPVEFTPTSAVPYAGEVVLLTNDPTSPRLSAGVQGTGDGGGRVSEQFEYALGNPTDVLVLVDNGPTMGTLLQRGIDAVGAFVDTLQEGDTDFHLAAVDLSGECEDGNLAFATAADSSASAESMMKSAFRAGVSPTSDDLLPIALEALAGGEDDCLAGFRREDASLHVIGVADGPSEAEFAANLEAIGAMVLPPYTLTVSTVTPSEACGVRALDWTDAARDTEGEVHDACSTSWHESFSSLAALTSKPSPVSFYLSGRPIESTIEVLVEGVTVTTWMYDEEINAIVFPVDARPPRGAAIEAIYVDEATCPAT